MNPILYIAKHLSLRGGRDNRRPPSVWIAATSVALTVLVLELTLSVVGGFRDGIIHKVRGFEPDITVAPAYDYSTGESDGYLRLDRSLRAVIMSAMPYAVEPELSMKYPAVIKTADDFAALVLHAYDKRHDFSFEKEIVSEGRLPDYPVGEGDNTIMISASVANAMKLGVGDKVDCYFFVDGNIKARKPIVAAIYDSSFGEADELIAYTSLPWLQKVAAIDSLSGTGIDIRGINDIEEVPLIAQQLQSALLEALQSGRTNKVYPVDNITHRASVYFSWLDLLDTNVVVIFVLMTCVAGFTLIASLFILILEKVRTIGLLRALGMNVNQMRNVFVCMAMRYVAIGLVIGNVLGIGIIFAQHIWRFIPLDPHMYYLAYVPVSFSITDVIWLNAGVVAVAWLVMILPAGLVSTVRPAQTMHYE